MKLLNLPIKVHRLRSYRLLLILKILMPMMALLHLALDMQSEKSKKAGNAPPTTLLVEFLKTSYGGCLELVLLEEDINFNQRATSITVSTSISQLGKDHLRLTSVLTAICTVCFCILKIGPKAIWRLSSCSNRYSWQRSWPARNNSYIQLWYPKRCH